MVFDVVQSDITNIVADAIVLPANEQLKEGSGASQAIFEKAGRKKLVNACKEWKHCRVGDAIPTRAFNLEKAGYCRYIIHAVVPKWVDGNHQEYDYLCAAYLSALKVADLMECESIAFPLLASGNNGFDLSLAYEIAEASILSFEGNHLQQATMVIYGERTAFFLRNNGVVMKDLRETEKDTVVDHVIQLFKDGKDVAEKIIHEQLNHAQDYIKDERNHQIIVEEAKKKVLNLAGFILDEMQLFQRCTSRSSERE